MNAMEEIIGKQSGGHVDVLIVGAGISGIGSARALSTEMPGKSFVVLEALDSHGGTWHVHRYPGVRSDTDLHTYSFSFKPWTSQPIAKGPEIVEYLSDVIDENDLRDHIRFNQRVVTASWSSEDYLWTVEVETPDGVKVYTTHFLWMCQGYYRHTKGYTPEWADMDKFKGQIIHPQHWPEDLDLTGKKLVLIGSGATAATLIPAIAGKCKHATLLQRSPTYFMISQNRVELAEELRSLEIDPVWIHEIVRRKLLHDQFKMFQRCADEPDQMKDELIGGVRDYLGPGYEEYVEKNFTPRYRPGSQRIAIVPRGDLFDAIKDGHASVVTDTIDRFTENGILLDSGEELEADIIVTATGFNLCPLGDVDFTVDGETVKFNDTITFKGMLFTGLPNMLWVMGYLRASWTLRVEMLSNFVCRLLKHMDEKGAHKVEVQPRPDEEDMELLPWLDTNDFCPGYLLRNIHLWPKRGDRPEWTHNLDYWEEKDKIDNLNLDSTVFRYE